MLEIRDEARQRCDEQSWFGQTVKSPKTGQTRQDNSGGWVRTVSLCLALFMVELEVSSKLYEKDGSRMVCHGSR
jgi:hypothetical protein